MGLSQVHSRLTTTQGNGRSVAVDGSQDFMGTTGTSFSPITSQYGKFKSKVPSNSNLASSQTEGMYTVDEGKGLIQHDREFILDMIQSYAESAFGLKTEINFEEYLDIITKKSSDLYFLPMVVLYRRLPCSENIQRIKRLLKQGNSSFSNLQVSHFAKSTNNISPTADLESN